MNYRNLGRSGVRVSEIGLASSRAYETRDRTDVETCVFEALERGVNFVSTSNQDAMGEAERWFGQILDPVPRRHYVLSSRVGQPLGEGPNDRGLSRKHIHESLHTSLRRLRTDYLDLFLCEGFDPHCPFEETARTMDDLVTHGKIMYWGTCGWSAEQIADVSDLCAQHGFHAPVAHQPTYNMIQRKIELEVLPVCRRYGIGVLAGEALGPSDLQKDFVEKKPSLTPLLEIAENLKLTPSQLALGWCLRLPEVSGALVDATSPTQVQEYVHAHQAPIPHDALLEIERILVESNRV